MPGGIRLRRAVVAAMVGSMLASGCASHGGRVLFARPEGASVRIGNGFAHTIPWSTHLGPEGTVNIAAVDLYAHPPSGPSPIYFDDVSLSNLPFLDGFESEDTRNWHFTLP